MGMFRLCATALPLVLLAPAHAWAQAAAADSTPLSEVIVTATKRPTKLQHTPMSITGVTGETIADKSINNLEELSSYTPNLTVADTSVTTNIYMRGIGSGLDRGFEQSVGMFIDGIYMSRSKQYRAPMFDLDRIEVLRGPQPVIFGKNTTVGAIQIETRKTRPGDPLTAEVEGEYEFENQGAHLSAVVGGSPAPTLGLRAAGLFEESDGFAYNSYLDQDDPEMRQLIGRLSAVWAPADGARVTAKYEYVDYETDGSLGEMGKISVLKSGNALFDVAADRLLYGPTGAFKLDPKLEDDVNFKRSSDNGLGPQGTDQMIQNGVLDIDWDTGPFTVTGVFGLSAYKYALDNDIDYLPVPLLHQTQREKFDQASAEVRIASNPSDSRIDYLAGLYWQQSDLNIFGSTTVNFGYLGPLVPLPTGLTPISSFRTGLNYGLKVDTLSPFAQVGVKLGEGVKALLGARYSRETKKVDRPGFCNTMSGAPLNPAFISDALARNSGLCPSLVTFSRKREEDHFMPSVQLQWEPSDAVTAYVKYDVGYKSGGFNAANFATLSDIEYQEEKAEGFELGLKTALLERRASLNIAVFNTKFTDLQVTTLTGAGQALLSNAAKATSRGVEIDGTLRANAVLTLGGSLAYRDSAYDSYKNGPCNAPQRSAAVGTTGPCFQDLSGRPTTYAPEWSGSFFAEGRFEVGGGWTLTARGDASYSDAYFYDSDLDPNTHQDSYWKLDARIALKDPTQRWDVALLAKNITNEAVAVWGTDVPLLLGTYVAFTGMPRTIAVQARDRFGG